MMIHPLQDSAAVPTEDNKNTATDPAADPGDDFAALLLVALVLPSRGGISASVEGSHDETGAQPMGASDSKPALVAGGEADTTTDGAPATIAAWEISPVTEHKDEAAVSVAMIGPTEVGAVQTITASDVADSAPPPAAAHPPGGDPEINVSTLPLFAQGLTEPESAQAREIFKNVNANAVGELPAAIGQIGEVSGELDHNQGLGLEREPTVPGLEAPARTVAKDTVLGSFSDGQNSVNRDDPAWPPSRERKNSSMEDLLSSKTFSPGPAMARPDTHSPTETAAAWRPTVERLAEEMVSRLRVGQRDAVIQLEPPELGKIKIDLRMEGDKLHARIVTEGHAAQSLLENHLPELRQALQANQVDLADVRVWHNGGSGANGDFWQGFQQTPQGRQQGAWNGGGAAGEVVVVPDAPGNELSSSETGRVSVWV